MKITIKEAFKKHNSIDIDYVFYCHCRKCKRYFDVKDEEYSFSGTREDFIEYLDQYPILDFDREIEIINGNHFIYSINSLEEELCEDCEKEDL